MPSVSVPFSGSPDSGSADRASPQRSYVPSVRPGIRAGGEISISTRPDGSQSIEYNSGADNSVPVQSHSAPSSSPLRFSRNGVPVLGRDVTSSDLVDLGGSLGETSVFSAIHNGWLTEGPQGGYARAGEASPQVSEQLSNQAPEVNSQSDFEAPVQDLLPATTEAILGQLQSAHASAYTALEAVLIAGKTPSAQDLDAAGSMMNLNREEVAGLVNKVVAVFQEQANHAIAGMIGDPDQLWAWAAQDPKGAALAQAARAQQARDRSLEGYTRLTQAYLVALADRDPKAVADGIVAGGGKAHVEAGKVMVDIGPGGTTTLAAAFRGGLADFTARKRGRK
jgi:hypothetical protein